MANFQDDLSELLNRFSRENDSNTPDFILAAFLDEVLTAWGKACRERERWYGVEHRPGEVKP